MNDAYEDLLEVAKRMERYIYRACHGSHLAAEARAAIDAAELDLKARALAETPKGAA